MENNQVKFTMYTGSGETGKARLARWERAARETHKIDRALLAWIRSVCDAAAEKALSKNKAA